MPGKDKRRAPGGSRAGVDGHRFPARPRPYRPLRSPVSTAVVLAGSGAFLMPEVTEAPRLEIQTVSSSDHARVQPIYRPSR